MTSPFRDGLLDGKVAFIAGGTSGINLGIAKRFAQLGAKVAVCGRDPDKAARAAAKVGHDAIGLSADVRDFGAIRGAMEQTRSTFGALDIVISGAAGNFLAPALGMSANAFKTVVDIDLLGTFNVFRGCHDLLAPDASLIAITAGQAVNAMQLQAHACAAKAGINQLVRVLALEWHFAGPDRGDRRHGPARPRCFHQGSAFRADRDEALGSGRGDCRRRGVPVQRCGTICNRNDPRHRWRQPAWRCHAAAVGQGPGLARPCPVRPALP
jgi:short chain dehydrogenase